MPRPNVLILMCDQMQARRMGFVDGIAHTPNLDALAAEGVHFSNAITVHGQCVPSRCAFVSGKSPHETNVMVNFGFHGHCGTLTPQSRTFFHEFQAAGYTTAHVGKSHLGAPLRTLGFDVGECLDGHFPEGKEPIERVNVRAESLATGGDGHVAQSGKKSCHYKALDEGLNWLKDYQPGQKPLLFMFDTNLPHPPFYYEEEWRERFKPEAMILPKSYAEETFEGKPAFLREHALRGPHKLASEAQLREEMAQYYTLISAVDKACGQIADVFKEKGMWDNTIVLFFADHGDMMGGHRLRRKGTMPYEEIYNIPCIIKLPEGMERKRAVIEEPVISTDLPGALLELAGIQPSPPFADSAVLQALRREAPTGDEQVFFEHYAAWYGIHPFYAVRTATMKYVRWYGADASKPACNDRAIRAEPDATDQLAERKPDDVTEELYDLGEDPDELHNLVDDPAYQARRQDLSARADAWWKRTGGRAAEFYATEAFKNNLNTATPLRKGQI